MTRFNTQEFLNALEKEFVKNENQQIAEGQKAYMLHQFDFYGIKSPERRIIQHPFLIKEFLPPKKELAAIVKTLWSKPQRDYCYFGQELAFKYIKQIEKQDIYLFEFMVTNKSWWDTVDFIANKLMGAYFIKYPELRQEFVDKWLNSNNIWLQRSALLFQLKYKEELDADLMSYTINRLLGSKEFFINKAIGWMLREYSKTNPDWVIDFVEKTPIANLSRREALRLIK